MFSNIILFVPIRFFIVWSIELIEFYLVLQRVGFIGQQLRDTSKVLGSFAENVYTTIKVCTTIVNVHIEEIVRCFPNPIHHRIIRKINLLHDFATRDVAKKPLAIPTGDFGKDVV